MLCISTSENKQKHSKMSKKVPFSSCAREALDDNKSPNKQPAFGSHSHSLTNKLFSSFFIKSLSCAWWKRYFFTHFQVFFIVFDHANACVCWSKYSFIQYVLSYLQANSKLLFTSHDTIASLYKVNGHRKNHLFLLNTTKWWNNFRENIFD